MKEDGVTRSQQRDGADPEPTNQVGSHDHKLLFLNQQPNMKEVGC